MLILSSQVHMTSWWSSSCFLSCDLQYKNQLGKHPSSSASGAKKKTSSWLRKLWLWFVLCLWECASSQQEDLQLQHTPSARLSGKSQFIHDWTDFRFPSFSQQWLIDRLHDRLFLFFILCPGYLESCVIKLASPLWHRLKPWVHTRSEDC